MRPLLNIAKHITGLSLKQTRLWTKWNVSSTSSRLSGQKKIKTQQQRLTADLNYLQSIMGGERSQISPDRFPCQLLRFCRTGQGGIGGLRNIISPICGNQCTKPFAKVRGFFVTFELPLNAETYGSTRVRIVLIFMDAGKLTSEKGLAWEITEATPKRIVLNAYQ